MTHILILAAISIILTCVGFTPLHKRFPFIIRRQQKPAASQLPHGSALSSKPEILVSRPEKGLQ